MTHQRVFRITEPTRAMFLRSRNSVGQSKEHLFAAAAVAQLPGLVDALVELGAVGQDQPRRPIRVPVSDDTLASLRDASELTGLPQSKLVECIMRIHFRATPRFHD